MNSIEKHILQLEVDLLKSEVRKSAEKYYEIFCENCIRNAIEEYGVKTIVAFNEKEVIGYLQYFYDVSSNELFIREIQISKLHQGDHETFRKLIEIMITDGQYSSINKVKGYINNNNEKSSQVFSSIGFKAVYEKNKGKIYTSDKELINRWLIGN